MFTDAQQRYIASLVASMRKDYPYYLAYSDFKSSSSDSPQIYIIFTKEKIKGVSMYEYSVPSGVRYAIRTNNYSTYYSNDSRHTVSAYSGGSLSIPVYEWIYTNSEFSSYSIQPDINYLYGGDYSAQLQTTNFIFCTACLCVLMLNIFFSFRRRF